MTNSKKYFDEANKAYDDGDFEKAIELLNKINPQDKAFYFKAQFNLALIFQKKVNRIRRLRPTVLFHSKIALKCMREHNLI
ncbi:hypothetical protein [Pasteurella multocida]|uniref:hypothetical protein n=1 Tax=Pasteurella multocida TaxID=747 RepID=UPI00202501DC|nr:hypothetical protein [Pasteurella multocida]URJ86700.1 hypothetical protein M9421_08080 [Pasteurella multocida]URJ88684.1 hypothetical protein M9412_08075 [Pasteurella multocida]